MCVQHPHKLPSIYWGYLANIYCRQIWRGRSGKDSRSDTEMALCSRRRYPPICPYRYLRNNKKAMEQWSDGATEKRAQLSCWFLRIWRGRPFPLFFFRNPPAQQLNLLRFWMELVPSGSQMGRRVMKNYTGHFVRLSTRLLRYSNFWSVKNIRLCMEIHTDFYGTYTWICKQIMAAFGRHIFLSFPHWVQLSWVGQNKGREQEIDNSLAQKFVAKQKNATKKKKGRSEKKVQINILIFVRKGRVAAHDRNYPRDTSTQSRRWRVYLVSSLVGYCCCCCCWFFWSCECLPTGGQGICLFTTFIYLWFDIYLFPSAFILPKILPWYECLPGCS